MDCFNALGFVPWVLVFDNMKTVTIGRDDQEQPIWLWDGKTCDGVQAARS